jgi:hypothetical protein
VPNQDTSSPTNVVRASEIILNPLEQVATHKVCIVCRFLDEHLHEVARRHFFLDPILAGLMDPPQLFFDRTQRGLGEHAQVDLRPGVSMTPIHLSFLESP